MKSAALLQPLASCMDGLKSHLNSLELLQPREKHVLITGLGSASRTCNGSPRDISPAGGRRFKTHWWRSKAILEQGERTGKLLTPGVPECIFYRDSTCPPQLREILDPPVTLFYRGTLLENGHVLAGIVGTRFPTEGRAKRRSGIRGLAKGVGRQAFERCAQAGGDSVGSQIIWRSSLSVFVVQAPDWFEALIDNSDQRVRGLHWGMGQGMSGALARIIKEKMEGACATKTRETYWRTSWRNN